MIEWGKMLETLIAAGAGAAVVVVIDWLVKYYLYKKKNFQEAISIQLALHQMLGVSLQIRQFYNNQEKHFSQYYSQEKISGSPNEVWLKFRHIDFSGYMNTFDVIKNDWDFTQFLTGKNNKVRDVLDYLVPIRLGYESLLVIIRERNSLLQQAHLAIERKQTELNAKDNFFYANDNLANILGQPINIKLREMTTKYIETLNNVITDSKKSFDVLSEYINENFCHYEPLSLKIPADMKFLLAQVIENDRKENEK